MSRSVSIDLAWDANFAIPVANAENKALEEEIQRKEKERVELENKLETCAERNRFLSEHLRNVVQELSHTQALCKVKERESSSEKHFKALAEREIGRLQQDFGNLQAELASLRELKNIHENNIFRTNQKLEAIRNKLGWDQQTLDAWLEEARLKDEETMAIVKFAQQDERRILSLTIAIEKKALEVNQKRKELEKELTEMLSVQIGLDKTAENLRQAHVDRDGLLHQWENTIDQMRKRDAEMQQCALEVAEVNKEIREKAVTLKEKEIFLENERDSNRQCEKKIVVASQLDAKLRQDLQEQESIRNSLQDELETLKGTVSAVATGVKTVRAQISNVKKRTLEQSESMEKAKLHNSALEEKLTMVTHAVLTREERVVQMEQLLNEEEQAIKDWDRQLCCQREALSHHKQHLQALRLKERESLIQLSGKKATVSSLNSQIRKLDENALKQKDIIANEEFKIQQLKSKLARLQGKAKTEEIGIVKKTTELNDILEEKKKLANTLSGQLKELESDVRCTKKEVEKMAVRKSDMNYKIEEIQLVNDISAKELKKIKLQKKDIILEDTLLKIEVKRLRDLLYNKADSVLSQEKRRLQLQAAMQDREEEIKDCRESLWKQIKNIDLEVQELGAEVRMAVSKTDVMRKRYEIMTAIMAPPEGDDEKSEIYYVIKAAQEKEELRQRGDELDATVRRVLTENKALENTIELINSCNSSYRKSISKVSESSAEYQGKLKLEVQKRAADEILKHKKIQIRELQEDIQVMNSTLDSLLQEEQAHNDRSGQTQSCISQLYKELASQKEKLDRASKQVSKLTKEIRSARKSRSETFEERDIELRQVKEFNKAINRMLHEALDANPDLRVVIERYLQQANMTLPPRSSTTASRSSSKSSSKASSYCSSARSSASFRSSGGSSASGSPRTPTVLSPTPATVDLGLGLTVTTPPRAASSSSSSSSSRGKRL